MQQDPADIFEHMRVGAGIRVGVSDGQKKTPRLARVLLQVIGKAALDVVEIGSSHAFLWLRQKIEGLTAAG